MYRNDQNALEHRLNSVSREADELRQENQAMRLAMSQEQEQGVARYDPFVYRNDIRTLPLKERSRLAKHSMKRFPVWAIGLLNVVTFGLFPLIHFGRMQDKLPVAAFDDPTAGKAIGCQFIPFYSLYWIFFSSLRLSDRLNLQLRLRKRPEQAPKGLLMAACIGTVIPYLSLVAIPLLWTLAVCRLQSTANKVAELDPMDWDSEELEALPHSSMKFLER